MTESLNPQILVVDDDPASRRLLATLLQAEGYRVLTADSGEAAQAMLVREQPDLILTDAMMPGMTGFALVHILKNSPITKPIPVIMLTSLDDRESRLHALEEGVEEFLNKPIDRAELRVRVRNLLALREYANLLGRQNQILEQRVNERTAQLRDSYQETIHTLARAAEYKDEETGAHIKRISYYCQELAQGMGMDTAFVDAIFFASPMHDVGKIGIPDHILLKPGPLDTEEWVVMRTHTVLGAAIIGEHSRSPYLNMARSIALGHHERWDGSGYPYGQKGEEIPLPARIMCVADIYDALRSHRPYKPPLDHDTAMTIILKGDKRTQPEHFDPHVLATCKQCAARLEEIFAEYI